MTIITDQIATAAVHSADVDRIADNLITSLDLARSMQMPLLERLLEMSLIELGQTVATQQKSERDRGVN